MGSTSSISSFLLLRVSLFHTVAVRPPLTFQAINALDNGTSDCFGFVDRGIWEGQKIEILSASESSNCQGEPFLSSMTLLKAS